MLGVRFLESMVRILPDALGIRIRDQLVRKASFLVLELLACSQIFGFVYSYSREILK